MIQDEITIGGRKIPVTNPEKVLFPDVGITKRDLIGYYVRIADHMLPYLKGRPLTMHRFPDGIEGESFYQQELSSYFPDWIHRTKVMKKKGNGVVHVMCDNAATLGYLAGQTCITPHVWLSRADKLLLPDQLIFDLDPSDHQFTSVARVALHLREFLKEISMKSFVKTTGSNGLHVMVPLQRKTDFDTVREFAHAVAGMFEERYSEEATTEILTDKRSGRVYIDVLRNSYGQTAVAPYAVRALPGAPVAAPLDWNELESDRITAQTYNIQNIFQKLEKKDPWSDISAQAYSIRRSVPILEAFRRRKQNIK
jgi:bifunctional non-homologous end joining protein LigD